MTDSYITGEEPNKKLQTYENTVGGNDVHSEAVTPTDENGIPFSNRNPFQVGPRDIFGNIKVSHVFNKVEVHLDDTNWLNFVDVTSAGSGSAAQANGQVTISTGATATSRYVFISKDAVVYNPNNEVGWGWTWRFPTTGTATCYSRIGATDTTSWANALFVGYEISSPTTITLTYRRGGTQIFSVGQASWLDPCDGSANSKYTSGGTPVALDPEKDQLMRVHCGLFGHAGFEVEIRTPDYDWIPIYRYTGINTLSVPVFSNFELKLAADVNKSSGTDNVQIASACMVGWTGSPLQRLSDSFTARTMVTPTVGVIRGATTAGGGGFVDVKVNPSGALTVEATLGSGTSLVGAAVPSASASVGIGTSHFRDPAVTNTAVAIKASSGKLHGYNLYNPNSSLAYVHFYNVAAASVVVGTTTPVRSIALPSTANGTVAVDRDIPLGIAFGTAMSVAASTTAAGGVAPGTALVVNAEYI